MPAVPRTADFLITLFNMPNICKFDMRNEFSFVHHDKQQQALVSEHDCHA